MMKPHVVLAAFITLIAVFSSYAVAMAFSRLRFDQNEVERLAEGEVIVRVVQSDSGRKRSVQGAVLIDSHPRHIWKIMLDCDQTPAFVPGLKSCRLLQKDDTTEIIEHQVKFTWLLPKVSYVFRATYQLFQRIDFEKISGDLKEFEGYWVLDQIDGSQKTIVLYSVYLDPGFFVPQWLVRKVLKKDLPAILIALRNRVSTLSPVK